MKNTSIRTSAENSTIKLLSEPKAFSVLGISKITLQRKRKDGSISFYQVGGRILYSPSHWKNIFPGANKRQGGKEQWNITITKLPLKVTSAKPEPSDQAGF
jgi:hypothetical protein